MATDASRPASVLSLAEPVTAELDRIKGSRFVADLAPITGPRAGLAFVAQVCDRHGDASHHCWAWRLADGAHRVDDDGEPGGTAGAPILRHLDGAGLSNVVCVVTRWFGGTKLGTGGLARAYGGAAAAAIEVADLVSRPVVIRFHLVHDYELTNAVNTVLATFGATTTATTYDTKVRLTVAVRAANATAFVASMREATSGHVDPQQTE